MFGDRCRKVHSWKNTLPDDLFESDISPETRMLVDLYTDDDSVSTGHTTMFFDIECEMHSGLPDVMKATNTITSIAAYDDISEKYVVFVLDEEGLMDMSTPNSRAILYRYDNEHDLLMGFIQYWEAVTPTIITGWNTDKFDVPYLYNRLVNVVGPDHAARLSSVGEVNYSEYRKKYDIAGVNSMDYLMLYRKFNYGQESSYSLNAISNKELGRGKIEYKGSLDSLFRDDIEKFIEYNITDVELVVEIDKKHQFIELARDICHVGHVPYEDIVYSSKYLEGALLTFLKRKNLVACNKPSDGQRQMQKLKDGSAKKFVGAYVKDPIVGRYDWVYDLDLTSLYPSIIMSLNISPETKMGRIMNWDVEKYMKNEVDSWVINGKTISNSKLKDFLDTSPVSVASNGVLYRTDIRGCIPDILNEWFDKRSEYKDLMKKFGNAGDEEQEKFYHKRQLVQKILLNSLYGVLGLPVFRFYDVDNASAVTTTGQTVIKNTARIVNTLYRKEIDTEDTVDYNIYIDTDSVFFSAAPLLSHRYPDYESKDETDIALLVDGIAGEMQEKLNAFYTPFARRFFNITKHRLEIKKEMIARSGIWIAKKRYAQWVILDNGIPKDRLDVKGLDVVRSSFPPSFKDMMSSVLIGILKGRTKKEIDSDVIAFRSALSTTSPKNIAKSSSVNGMKKYKPPKNGNMFDFQKSTPAHVKAAIAYNQLLLHFKCPFNHEPIKNGDKFKWVYLQQNPFGLTGLAFRGEDDPKEIEDLVSTYVDYEKIFERELQSKLQDFYNALNWGPLPYKESIADRFFTF